MACEIVEKTWVGIRTTHFPNSDMKLKNTKRVNASNIEIECCGTSSARSIFRFMKNSCRPNPGLPDKVNFRCAYLQFHPKSVCRNSPPRKASSIRCFTQKWVFTMVVKLPTTHQWIGCWFRANIAGLVGETTSGDQPNRTTMNLWGCLEVVGNQ